MPSPTDPALLPPSDPDWKQLLRDRARTSKRLSWLLDESIRIPGTQLRFGLDPLLGLIPYGGETLSAIIGAVILGEAGQKGLPFRTLTKMGGNMVLNAAVGTIPVLGDLFSFWFKSNTRNYRMLSTYLESERGEEARGGWWPVVLILGFLAVVLVLNVLSWIILGSLVYAAFHWLSGMFA